MHRVYDDGDDNHDASTTTAASYHYDRHDRNDHDHHDAGDDDIADDDHGDDDTLHDHRDDLDWRDYDDGSAAEVLVTPEEAQAEAAQAEEAQGWPTPANLPARTEDEWPVRGSGEWVMPDERWA